MSEPPDHPLAEDEILGDRELSAMLWEALVAFGTDPGYFTDMCLAAQEIGVRRELMRRSNEARSRAARLNALLRSLGEKVQLDGDCWTWTASRTNKGVPQMHRPGTPGNRSKITARSWTVEQWHGPDDARWMIQSTCGNRLCVNPEHATWRHVDRRTNKTTPTCR